jgi:hypothetical protein
MSLAYQDTQEPERAGLARPSLAVRGKGAVMPQQREWGLSLAEWLVLCLINEGPRTASRSRACWRKTAAWARSGTCSRGLPRRAEAGAPRPDHGV